MNLNQIEMVSDAPIDLGEMIKLGHDVASGALVLFSGEVRNHNEGRGVVYLEYEAHKSMAEKSIREIIADAKERWPLNFALCVHRVGPVQLTECAVVVITSSVHRGEAYAANRYIIDRVKYEAPIWKREFFTDGTSKWGRNCEHPPGEHAHDHGHSHDHAHGDSG